MNMKKNFLGKLIMAILMLMATLETAATAALIAHYPMTEGYGTSLIDISGNGNHATAAGTSWDGSILNFDGVSDYALVANSQSLNITTNSMTLMAWIKWDIDPATGNDWATFVNMNTDNQYRLQHNKDNSAFEFAIRTTLGNKWVFSGTAPRIDQWYHLAGTYDGSSLNMYVNGLLENSVSHSGTIVGSNKPLIIGNNPANNRGFAGSIVDMRIYDTALSESDIALIAATAWVIPEPATVILLGLGAIGLVKRRRCWTVNSSEKEHA